MLESLALDALLILILFLLVPVGMYRGGVREVCVSAGLLLGILVSASWAERWGNSLADISGIDDGVSRFIIAVATIVVVTGVIGYGAAASFAHRPGPGGRMLGGLIALANGVVFLGALIQLVSTHLYEGIYPEIVRRSYAGRALSSGFDWVLLAVAAVALLAIIFGMIVRERDPEGTFADLTLDNTRVPERRPIRTTPPAVEPVNIEPARASADQEPTAAIKIKEVRHWEEPVPSTMDELQRGWSRTWPSTVKQVDPGARTGQGSRPTGFGRRPSQSPNETLIRDWLSDDTTADRPARDRTRPASDE